MLPSLTKYEEYKAIIYDIMMDVAETLKLNTKFWPKLQDKFGGLPGGFHRVEGLLRAGLLTGLGRGARGFAALGVLAPTGFTLDLLAANKIQCIDTFSITTKSWCWYKIKSYYVHELCFKMLTT